MFSFEDFAWFNVGLSLRVLAKRREQKIAQHQPLSCYRRIDARLALASSYRPLLSSQVGDSAKREERATPCIQRSRMIWVSLWEELVCHVHRPQGQLEEPAS
jgi:hypothetical protein